MSPFIDVAFSKGCGTGAPGGRDELGALLLAKLLAIVRQYGLALGAMDARRIRTLGQDARHLVGAGEVDVLAADAPSGDTRFSWRVTRRGPGRAAAVMQDQGEASRLMVRTDTLLALNARMAPFAACPPEMNTFTSLMPWSAAFSGGVLRPRGGGVVAFFGPLETGNRRSTRTARCR